MASTVQQHNSSWVNSAGSCLTLRLQVVVPRRHHLCTPSSSSREARTGQLSDHNLKIVPLRASESVPQALSLAETILFLITLMLELAVSAFCGGFFK